MLRLHTFATAARQSLDHSCSQGPRRKPGSRGLHARSKDVWPHAAWKTVNFATGLQSSAVLVLNYSNSENSYRIRHHKADCRV